MKRVRVAAAIAAFGAAVAIGVVAAAADKPAPTLHEYVAPPASREGGRIVSFPGAQEKSQTGQEKPANPSAIRHGSKLLVQPPLADKVGAGEQVHGNSPFAVDRETTARPDRQTEQDGTLHYSEVFNPSVVPFKRMSSLNAVDEDFTLFLAPGRMVEVPVGGDATPDRDLFWGSLVLHLRPGEDIAIPSVAPEMRVLSYESEPKAKIAFLRDAADNYYVRSDDPRNAGQIRLVFLVDAPATYFAPKFPAGSYTVADVAALGMVQPLPPNVRRSALTMLERLAIRPDTPLEQAVNALVAYHRTFEAGDPPEESGEDIYQDLFLSQRGVCRHRSFSFFVSATALGIPTRYITNEAHAFAEVWVPEHGWMRVDLGGSAQELDVANSADKAMHRPRAEDPFPRPPQYRENYTQFRGVQGLSDQQKAEAREPLVEDPSASPTDTNRSTDPVTPGPGRTLPKPTVEDVQGKTKVAISVDRVDGSAYRGEIITVGGKLAAEGKPVGGLRVDVYLASSFAASPDQARLVGQTVTRPDGSYELAVTLPKDLDLGEHTVYAATPGNGTFAMSISE
jgi:hypothetical protein